jgi:hypothetical protein
VIRTLGFGVGEAPSSTCRIRLAVEENFAKKEKVLKEV